MNCLCQKYLQFKILLLKNKILLGSNNAGKLREIKFYLDYFKIFQEHQKLNPSDFKNINEPIEDGKTFNENAKIKSNFFYGHTQCLSLSDDSGLVIDDLGEYPGVKTARVAKEMGGEQKVIDYIFSKFNNKSQLRATFYCSLALFGKDKEIICSGKVKGNILPNGRGKNGFGYDPYFVPLNHIKTFAEMASDEKMLVSHRFNAFKILTSQI